MVFERTFLLGFQCAIHRSGSCGVSVASNFIAVFHPANAFERGFELMAMKFLFFCSNQRGGKTSVTSLIHHPLWNAISIQETFVNDFVSGEKYWRNVIDARTP